MALALPTLSTRRAPVDAGVSLDSAALDELDHLWMQRALRVAERGRCTAAPNPWVGCVVVRDGRLVGEGFHRRAGEPHAEAHALAAAGALAQGATAYVTLEPCAHVGRTPPCVDALIQAGVARVVVGVLDPDPRVAGRGMRRLAAAGIQTRLGVLGTEVAASLRPYLHQRRTRRAFCVVKSAVSIDGRTAAADGSSQWISGSAARADTHQLRAESQAILIGSGTALADLPALTVRDSATRIDRQPLRVLLDARGRTAATGPLFDQRLAPTLVLTSAAADPGARAAWLDAGAEVAEVSTLADGSLDLTSVLERLAERGVLQVLVEGGASTAAAFARARLIDRLVIYVGALTLGAQGLPLLAGPGPRSMAEATHWRLLGVRPLDDDVRLDYAPAEVAA